MRKYANFLLQRSLNAARSSLGFVWSRITDIAFLTLLIAVGTLATAFVAYQNARDSHQQLQLLKRQVDLSSTETRPFLRLKPTVSLEKRTRISFNVINLGRVPGRVIAYDMVVQVGRNVIEPKGGTFNTGDILYPDQPGLGIFQTLTQAEVSAFEKGLEPLVVGACTTYGSITRNDTRRWEVSVIYRFDSLGDLPRGLFANEVDVPAETDKCDASSLRDKWLSQLKLHPK